MGESKLIKVWRKHKAKLDRVQDLERQARKAMGDALVPSDTKSKKLTFGDYFVAIQRKIGYSVPSKSIKKLKKKLSPECFEELFYVNYSIREGAYNSLGERDKKIVDKLITVREAPYQVAVKQQ